MISSVESITLVGWLLVSGSLAAGIGTLGLIGYLGRHRDAPGATWFMAMLGAQALWIASYTTGLFITAPLWRATAEAAMWVGIAWLGPLFLAFALTYTGRSTLVGTPWFRAVFVPPVVTVVLAATHPFHALLWQDFHLAPVFGLAAVQYAFQPWDYVAIISSLATAGVGVLLLVGTVVSYGPLYRKEAISVALSTLPPAAAAVAWIAGLGPWPALNLAAVMFFPHVLLDAYAFVGTHMFDTNPTTQRAAERGALSDLDDPLLVVDPNGRVVNMNTRARSLFEADQLTLPTTIEALVGIDLTALLDAGEYTVPRRNETYAVSHTPLEDPGGNDVGAILVFYDITRLRRQKQRLSVLNRILRHNLRNQLNVAQGRADLIAAETTDPEIRTHTDAITRSTEQLLSIGRRIRDFERVQNRGISVSTVDPVRLTERVTAALLEDYPGANLSVETTVDSRPLETDEEILALAVTNLLENAVVHSETAQPVVDARLYETGEGEFAFEIRDRNDPIPDIEIETLDAAEESALQHGQGIGLWVVTWCLEFVDGDLSFAYDDGNVVTVTVPQTTPAVASVA